MLPAVDSDNAQDKSREFLASNAADEFVLHKSFATRADLERLAVEVWAEIMERDNPREFELKEVVF